MKAIFILNDLPLRQRSLQRCTTTRICCAELVGMRGLDDAALMTSAQRNSIGERTAV